MMHPRRQLRFARVLTWLAVCVPLASSGLEWVSTSYAGTTLPWQTTLDVAFSFRNAGSKAVSVSDVQTNCDCLAAGTDKTVYQPGEAGVIAARFTVGDRYGLHSRTITVLTDDGARQQLAVSIEVPEPASVVPRQLEWAVGSAAREQAFDVRPAGAGRVDFTETFATNDAFGLRLEVLEAGRHYRVHVIPRRMDAVANAAIRLKGVAPNGMEIIVSAYANVR